MVDVARLQGPDHATEISPNLQKNNSKVQISMFPKRSLTLKGVPTA